jgi:hypothetical protein
MPKKIKPGDIKNIVIVSDTHFGCQFALMHPAGAILDGGLRVKPSKIQLAIWGAWRHFWSDWVPMVTHGEPFYFVHNGDVIDGSHHGATTQWSQNITDQIEHAAMVLGPVIERCRKLGGEYYHIRGTEAHVGQSGRDEEMLARRLGAKQSGGNAARWELMKNLGGHLIHFSHHIGTTSSAAHESSAVNAEMSLMFTNAGRAGLKPPDIVVRSHRHRCIEVRLPAEDIYRVSFTTAAWQAKTPFSYRLPGGRASFSSQIGGSVIRLGDEEIYTRHFVRDVITCEAE